MSTPNGATVVTVEEFRARFEERMGQRYATAYWFFLNFQPQHRRYLVCLMEQLVAPQGADESIDRVFEQLQAYWHQTLRWSVPPVTLFPDGTRIDPVVEFLIETSEAVFGKPCASCLDLAYAPECA